MYWRLPQVEDELIRLEFDTRGVKGYPVGLDIFMF